jgi:hypothetical protein
MKAQAMKAQAMKATRRKADMHVGRRKGEDVLHEGVPVESKTARWRAARRDYVV